METPNFVLLVDSDRRLLCIIAGLLQDAGYQVAPVTSGPTALLYLEGGAKPAFVACGLARSSAENLFGRMAVRFPGTRILLYSTTGELSASGEAALRKKFPAVRDVLRMDPQEGMFPFVQKVQQFMAFDEEVLSTISHQ